MNGPASHTRRRALVVALVGAIGLGAVAIATSGGEEADGLRVERSQVEVVVYVTDPAANKADRADGGRTVTLECVDKEGEVLKRAPVAWPLTDTDGGTLGPHTHLPIDPVTIQQVDRCRLRGTDPMLEGGVL